MNKKKSVFSPKQYAKYIKRGTELFENEHDSFLKKAVMAKYSRYESCAEYTGNTALSLDTVVDMICYFANSPYVHNLYLVKLMKMLWYADALSYKHFNNTISGMVYIALPMGAVPISYKTIIDLNGIKCEEIEMGDDVAYKFVKTSDSPVYQHLSEENKAILDEVINRFGSSTKDEIVNAMHNEDAYKNTKPNEIISFEYAKTLSL